MARRPRPSANQLDLFARPAPAPAVMEPRGSITAPLAGEYSADEAQLAADGSVVVHNGYRFQDGTSCCVGCFPTFAVAKLDRGHGYRMSVYRSNRNGDFARCAACTVPFAGMTAQEELDRRRGIKTADGSSSPPSCSAASVS